MTLAATDGKRIPWHFGDHAFKWLTLAMALAVFALIVLIGYELFRGSHLALQKFGWHFLVTSNWDPVNDEYGALPFIYGTLVSSLIALVIAVPISVATAVYLTELAPLWLRQPLIMFIELLAAVPISVATAVYLTELAPLWRHQPLIMFIELLAAVPISVATAVYLTELAPLWRH